MNKENLEVTRTESDLHGVRQWVADVCYPPTLKVWKEDAIFGFQWCQAPEQPDWRHLSFDEWLEKFSEMSNEYDCDDGAEFVIRRPCFQGWRTSILKIWTIAGECGAHDCTNPATSRIAWNHWGTCCESLVCPKHRDRHGVWADSL